MSFTDGLAGFPLVNGIPRGEAFVDFMSRTKGTTSRSTSTVVSTSSPAGRIAGGFDENATQTRLSETRNVQPNGGVLVEYEDVFSDGSRREMQREKAPDGTIRMNGERRSLPDADGFEKVRVWTMVEGLDGEQSRTMRVFRVPAGTEMDWTSAAAQDFLIDTRDWTVPAALPEPPAVLDVLEEATAVTAMTEDSAAEKDAQQ